MKNRTLEITSTPIFVGLIGHRDINESEIPSLQREFDRRLGEILLIAADTPVVILTPLAKGADRLAQSSSLRSRIKICAVLPLKKNDYEKDFKKGKERQEFQAALKEADFVIETPWNVDVQSFTASRDRRDSYEACGHWISDRSSILFALWDGNEERGRGGTASTIQYRNSQSSVTAGHLDTYQLIHIYSSNSGSNIYTECICGGHDSNLAKIEKFIFEFNRLNHLLTFDSRAKDSAYVQIFKAADKVAGVKQTEFRRKTKTVLILGALGVNFASITQDTFNLIWFSSTLMAFLFTSWYFFRFKRLRTKELYESCRLIAEVLRIDIWLKACDFESGVERVLIGSTEIDVNVRGFLMSVFSLETITGSTMMESSNPLAWIKNQVDYLEGAKGKPGAIQRNLAVSKKIKLATLVSSIAGIIAFLSIPVLTYQFHIDQSSWILMTEKTLFTILLSASAVFAAYREISGLDEIAARFARSSERFHTAIRSYGQSKRPEERRAIILQVASESLAETGRWYQVKHDKDVQPFQS